MHNLGSVYYQLGEVENAKTYLEGSLELFRVSGRKEDIASTLNKLSEITDQQGVSEASQKYLEEAMQIYRSLERKDVMTNILNNLGVKKGEQGKYNEATKYFQEGLSIEDENAKVKGVLLNNIGVALNLQGEFEKSISSLNSALRVHEENEDNIKVIGTLNNIAVTTSESGNISDAEKYLTTALHEIQQVKNAGGRVSGGYVLAVLDNMAKLRFRLNSLIDDLFGYVDQDMDISSIRVMNGWWTIKKGYEMVEKGNFSRASELITEGEKMMNDGGVFALSHSIWQNLKGDESYVY